ncbi:uncharacterized protein BBOV_IV009060 [Babesia bovis T2Bo]|uniref:Membrane protein, putative n=1 Tax=Babesia bovis TaxID=5865 RepID=A7ARU1_BABBO|nr:uncharacterized protein BBOV_IV009060 [Babesia bovis T2Bo]EDO07260.1 putative integral membrane protein [Babesia bovis T2Bo]|eukprot:XP_001610828.1 hypothetical protein [Babesia bovis T2Bo]
MKPFGLIVPYVLFIFSIPSSVDAIRGLRSIKAHNGMNGDHDADTTATIVNKNEDVKSETTTEENKSENKTEESQNEVKHNQPEPLNLIFNPTVQQVSDESKRLLESLETGLRNIRSTFHSLTHMIRLLSEPDKQKTITIDKKEYNFTELLDAFSNYIADGERYQRGLIEATAEILHILATPHNASQTS